MTSEEEGRKSIQRILSQINPPNIPPVPSPPAAHVAPGRRVQRAVMSGRPVEPFVNDSRHAVVAPAFRPTCSSNQGGFAFNEPISDAVSRPCGGVRQSGSSRPSEEIHRGRFPINRSASAPVARPLDDHLIPRSTPIPPIIAKSISAPRISRFDIVRYPTITMRDRYPVILPSSSNHGTAPASSGQPQLATAVDGEAVTVVTRQEHDVPAPSPVSNAERSGPNLHNNAGEDTFEFLSSASHTEPESMLAYNHLP
jgi:hypothetical protein